MRASTWDEMRAAGWSEGQCRMLGLVPPEEVGELETFENRGSGMRVVQAGSSTAVVRTGRGSGVRSFAPGKGAQS